MTGAAPRRVAGLVLAAGGSRRMGRPKPLLSLGDETLLAAAVHPHLAAGLDPVVVVLGCRAAEVRRDAGLPADPRLRIVVNDRWEEGLATSVAAGVAACGEAEALVVTLADQPGMGPERLRRVIEAWDGRAPVVAALASGYVAHPVLFARSVFDELRRLTGDSGGRAVVQRHRAAAILVDLPPLADLDTEADWHAYVNVRRSGHGAGDDQ